MITQKSGSSAAIEIERWALALTNTIDPEIEISVYADADSSTYVLRLARGSHVLLFRLSEAQVRSPEREAECEKTLRAKVKDLGRYA